MNSSNLARCHSPRSALDRLFRVALLAFALGAPFAQAAEAVKKPFDVPAADAVVALKQFAAQAGRDILYLPESVRGTTVNAVKGELTPREALDRMVAGTALIVSESKGGILAVKRVNDPNGSRAAPSTASDRPQNQNRVPSTREVEQVVELSPFTVTESQDVGYLAANTLAGSRLNTPLKDTAASISVFTREFLDDLGATDVGEALLFANNLQVNEEDQGTFGDTSPGNSLMQEHPSYRVRGIRAQLARNYFRWDAPSDTYNVGRVEDSRGPNSVLFGIGSAGGVINVSTKQAELKRAIRAVSLSVDSNDSRRVALDYNQALGDKAAIRVNAVWNETRRHMHHVFADSARVHLAAKYRFNPKWQARVEYEHGDLESSRGRNNGISNYVIPWLNAGRPTFDRNAPNSDFTGLGSRLAANQLRYVSNSGQTINMTGQIVTTGSTFPIMDRSIADYSIGSGGPGHWNKTPYRTYSAFLEGQLGAKSAVEFGFNHQESEWEGYDSVLSQRLFGDASSTLPGTLGVNPRAGTLFMETQWRQQLTTQSANTARLMFSTEFDFGKWGRYRPAVLAEYEQSDRQGGNRFEVWEGAPFNANPIAAANRVTRRSYITEGDWKTYWVDGPTLSGLIQNATDPITGRTLSSTFSFPQTRNDDPTAQWSGLLGLRGSWFDGRLVAGTGYRADRISITNYATKQDAERRNVVDYDTFDKVTATGRTYTLGVVGHVGKHVSLLYNQANNIAMPTATTAVLPDLRLPDAPQGVGRDYGIAFELPGQRIYIRAVRFTTASQGELRSGTSGTGHVNRNNTILDALQAANLIAEADFKARYFFDKNNGFIAETLDRASEGYELSVTGNPTRNWRLTVNYSQTTGAEENILAEVLPWWAERRAFYAKFPQDTPLADGIDTIAKTIQDEDDYIANVRTVEGLGIVGNRKHKVNFFTRYTFDGGLLRGAYFGGGYRYQGRMLVGRYADNSLRYSPAYGEATFMAGYTVRMKERRRLSLQVNISNLFDETDPIIIRYATTGDLNRPRNMIIRDPRTARLTANFSF